MDVRACGRPETKKEDRFEKQSSGAPSGNRTPDTLIKSQVLYRLS